jgi:ABC-type Zn uptake system ZnuABC Zn-binding protein ZnuA
MCSLPAAGVKDYGEQPQGEWMKQRQRGLWPLLGAILLIPAMVTGCGGSPPTGEKPASALAPAQLGEGELLRVVATTNIVGDIIRNVGGDHLALTTLMAVGVDPHSYVPAPADTAALHDAHVVFANGLGLEADLEEMFESAGGDAVHIHLSDELNSLLAVEEAGHGNDSHEDAGADPHVWFDAQNVIQWVQVIERVLSTLDPDNAPLYTENARVYTNELQSLDTWIEEQVDSLPVGGRELVTNHPAFGYLAERYGLKQIGAVYPVSPSAEPSARDIAALEDAIREYGVSAVFTESTVNVKLAQQVADDTGVALVQLFSGSLGKPGSGAETYLQFMRYNVRAIVEALD